MTAGQILNIIRENASAVSEILKEIPIADSDTVGESIKYYGETIQTVVAMEECSELIQVCSKMLRGKEESEHLCEEIADVYISLEILKQIYKIDAKDIQEIMRRKEARTRERMRNGE